MTARNFTPALRAAGAVDVIVIHTTEGALHPGAARAVASWFAGPSAPQASAHYVVDCGEVIQCVREEDIAWAAPGANKQGIHIELCGRASWTPEDWAAPHAVAMLALARDLMVGIASRWDIALWKLTPEDLLNGGRGVCGHVDVSQAWKRSDHFDPGVAFPWASLLP